MPLNKIDETEVSGSKEEVKLPKKEFKRGLKKRVIAFFIVVHVCGLYGFYLIFFGVPKWQTVVLAIILNYASMVGVTAGTHRLWAHRAYKAKLPLQILLMIMQSIAFQLSVVTWVRDHRAHHKYSDTDADPHNSKRGLFFSHIGWLMSQKHPDVKLKGKGIDLSDVYNNSVLRFQHNYYMVIASLACFIIPSLIPLLWKESFSVALNLNLTRYMVNLQCTCLTNSAAHKWGNKPYDKQINPTQNIMVSIVTLGEGFHNYHHTFPFDYRTAELGNNILNPTTKIIDFFAWIGWAYDLKTTTPDMVASRATRAGDGTGLWS